jgi:hypothetical protein
MLNKGSASAALCLATPLLDTPHFKGRAATQTLDTSRAPCVESRAGGLKGRFSGRLLLKVSKAALHVTLL